MAERPVGGIGIAAARGAIRAYQLTLSALFGRHCRHLPTCSAYVDEAIAAYGVWAGGWIGFARICRCNPWGTSGLDLVPARLPAGAHWYAPWRYGRWRGVNAPAMCEDVSIDRGGPHL
jgi:putative membrane protein insertion efficiency factor